MGSRAGNVVVASLVLACSPSSDLDAHARGSGPAAGGGPPLERPPEQLPATPDRSDGPVAAVAVDGESTPAAAPLLPPVVADSRGDVFDAGADTTLGSPPGVDAAVPEPQQPPVEPPILVEPIPPSPPAFAAPLPDDLSDAPVAGEIIFSDEAEWEVDGVFEPTFEIRTPTASYWVVKPLGTIVSIEDAQTGGDQWIAFSSGFRPLRGVPSFPTPPATRVTTVRDSDSQTPTHVRLTAVSGDDLWQWVWDFYVTHVTFTINRAPVPYAFAYQGVPGGVLGAEDQLVSSDGIARGARSSFNGDLAGPVEWAYLADTTLARSLFAIQHQDDTLAERYVVRDNDTALLSFGNGQIQTVPMRFSLGLLRTTNHAAVSARVEFVAGAIR